MLVCYFFYKVYFGGFGFLGGIQSFGGFTSTAVVGLLYSIVSPAAGFIRCGVDGLSTSLRCEVVYLVKQTR